MRDKVLSVSPLGFDSALHGTNNDHQYVLRPDPHDLHNHMNVSSFDVQDSAREIHPEKQADNGSKPNDDNSQSSTDQKSQQDNQTSQNYNKKPGLICDLAEIKYDEFSKNCLPLVTNNTSKYQQNKQSQFDSQKVVIDLLEDSKKSNALLPTTASDKLSSQFGQKQSLIQSQQPSITLFNVNGDSSQATGNSITNRLKEPKDYKKVEEEMHRIKRLCNIDGAQIILSPKSQNNLALKACQIQSLLKDKEESKISGGTNLSIDLKYSKSIKNNENLD